MDTPCTRAGRATSWEARAAPSTKNGPRRPAATSSAAGSASPESFPDAFRPDLLGVIVIRIRWRDAPAYLLLSAGREPDAALLEWMRAFSRRTRRPFFYEHHGEKLAFGPPAFQADMLARLERGEPMW